MALATIFTVTLLIWFVNGLITLFKSVKDLKSYGYDDVFVITEKDWESWEWNRKDILRQNQAGENRFMVFINGNGKRKYQILFK